MAMGAHVIDVVKVAYIQRNLQNVWNFSIFPKVRVSVFMLYNGYQWLHIINDYE